jgi:hypothetical protein
MMSYRASIVGDEGTLLGRLAARLEQSPPPDRDEDDRDCDFNDQKGRFALSRCDRSDYVRRIHAA